MHGRRLVMREPLRVEMEDLEIDESSLQEGDLLVRHRVTAISPGTTAPERDGAAPPRVPVRQSREANIRYILELLRLGPEGPRLRIAPLRTHVLPPVQAQDAYRGLHERPDSYLAIVFQWPVT